MKWRTERVWIGVVLVGLAVGAAPIARADVTITMATETAGMGGAQTTTTVQYYTATKMRNEYGESSISIMDLDEEVMITLIPAAKVYMKQTFDVIRQQSAMVKLPEQKLTIEETEEKETISGYDCHKVIVRTVEGDHETATEHWVAKDVKGIDDVRAFLKGMSEAFKDSPQHQRNAEVTTQLMAKGYFPIKTILHIPNPDGETLVTMTVTKIEEGDLEESIFEAPDDYTEANFGGPGGGSDSE